MDNNDFAVKFDSKHQIHLQAQVEQQELDIIISKEQALLLIEKLAKVLSIVERLQ